jgi:recombination protein RecA
MALRSHLESLLRARKLDVTLTRDHAGCQGAKGPECQGDDLASVGVPVIDAALGGGLRRGQLSEIVGRRSSGRTGVMHHAMRAATVRDELVALVDTDDRFDPDSASAAGVDLSRLLWIRETGDVNRAVKAMNLVLQAGGFGLVVLDVADLSGPAIRGLPFTTWFRLARVIEGSPTVALAIAAEHLARSAGGTTIALEPSTDAAHVQWIGDSNRARLLGGVFIRPRVIEAGR